ncbi:Arginine-glutamic acid dipeptide repeats protein [Nymphon striatum]|nr:Arginine-glutamic acid dipeptide repeats protein [Nymphon striatum]
MEKDVEITMPKSIQTRCQKDSKQGMGMVATFQCKYIFIKKFLEFAVYNIYIGSSIHTVYEKLKSYLTLIKEGVCIIPFFLLLFSLEPLHLFGFNLLMLLAKVVFVSIFFLTLPYPYCRGRLPTRLLEIFLVAEEAIYPCLTSTSGTYRKRHKKKNIERGREKENCGHLSFVHLLLSSIPSDSSAAVFYFSCTPEFCILKLNLPWVSLDNWSEYVHKRSATLALKNSKFVRVPRPWHMAPRPKKTKRVLFVSRGTKLVQRTDGHSFKAILQKGSTKKYTDCEEGNFSRGTSAISQIFILATLRNQVEHSSFGTNVATFGKRNNLFITIRWFYRATEIPEVVYQRLVQDRNLENSKSKIIIGMSSQNELDSKDLLDIVKMTEHVKLMLMVLFESSKDLFIQDPVIGKRELFISDTTSTHPVSALRGICFVDNYLDILSAQKFEPRQNTFFYILGYNPETRRLANTQGEIRVGPSHQARLPEYRANVSPIDMPEKCEPLEELQWLPNTAIEQCNIVVYLQAARSMAAFAGMCDGGSADDGCLAACKDDTTINAMDTLHSSKYNTSKALQALVKNPVPVSIHKKWSEDDQKRFVKGLRQYGKNFFKIRKELLPHKETGDLVEFYYLWKKTPAASNARPHRRHRRQNVLRRIRTGTRGNNRPNNDYSTFLLFIYNRKPPLDMSSASEEENDSDDSDSRDMSGYACHHCFTTTSKDWHHAGKDRNLLCTECRMHYKKYGQPRPLLEPREPPSFLFKPIKDEDSNSASSTPVNGKHGMRTRRCKENSNVSKTRQRSSRPGSAASPDVESTKLDRKSPSTGSSCSNSSTDKGDKVKKKVCVKVLCFTAKLLRVNAMRSSLVLKFVCQLFYYSFIDAVDLTELVRMACGYWLWAGLLELLKEGVLGVGMLLSDSLKHENANNLKQNHKEIESPSRGKKRRDGKSTPTSEVDAEDIDKDASSPVKKCKIKSEPRSESPSESTTTTTESGSVSNDDDQGGDRSSSPSTSESTPSSPNNIHQSSPTETDTQVKNLCI